VLVAEKTENPARHTAAPGVLSKFVAVSWQNNNKKELSGGLIT
jgi:hypothetical protein